MTKQTFEQEAKDQTANAAEIRRLMEERDVTTEEAKRLLQEKNNRGDR